MPLLTALRKLVCCAGREEEQARAPARPPMPAPVAAGTGEPGRPYREYVENEAGKFREGLMKSGNPGPAGSQFARGAGRGAGMAERAGHRA